MPPRFCSVMACVCAWWSYRRCAIVLVCIRALLPPFPPLAPHSRRLSQQLSSRCGDADGRRGLGSARVSLVAPRGRSRPRPASRLETPPPGCVAPPDRHFTVTAESFSEIKSFPRAKWRAVALGCTSIQKQRSSALARPSGCCTRPSATENASAVQQELPLQRRARAALHCTDAVMMEDERGDARFVLAGLA